MGKKAKKKDKLTSKEYEKELERLQGELVKLQYWIRDQQLKVVVIFEGRDAAGKGGTIARITAAMNPRVCEVVALPAPTERQKTQWYFKRYVEHLPAAGEIVMFESILPGVPTMSMCDFQVFLAPAARYSRLSTMVLVELKSFLAKPGRSLSISRVEVIVLVPPASST